MTGFERPKAWDEGPSLGDFMPETAEGSLFTAGEPLDDEPGAPAEAAVVAALKTVYDPEIPVDIYELGLIYEIAGHPTGDVDIKMSLTAPACPVAGTLPGQVAEAVAEVDGVGVARVELVWDPAWSSDRMSEDAKMALDLF